MEGLLTKMCRDSYWNRLPDYMKRDLGLTFDSDGEFYMCFNRDFIKSVLYSL